MKSAWKKLKRFVSNPYKSHPTPRSESATPVSKDDQTNMGCIHPSAAGKPDEESWSAPHFDSYKVKGARDSPNASADLEPTSPNMDKLPPGFDDRTPDKITRRLTLAAGEPLRRALRDTEAVQRVATQWQHSVQVTKTRYKRSNSRVAVEISKFYEAEKANKAAVEQSLQGEAKLLETRLEHLRLHMRRMGDDGNCQFRSCSHHLYGNEKHYQKVRDKAVGYIREHQDDFNIFFEDDREFRSYVSNMAKNRTWGDELTLRAVCDAYGIEIHVVQSTKDNWYLVYHPEAVQTTKRLFITYLSPVHYNALEIIDSEEPEPQPPPRGSPSTRMTV